MNEDTVPRRGGTIGTFTSRRLRRKIDACMIHRIYRVVDFEIVALFTLRLHFDDGTEQRIDFKRVLAGELYAPLSDVELFNRVRIDPEVHTLVWPNGADFDPATLHDWPLLEPALAERARRWQAA